MHIQSTFPAAVMAMRSTSRRYAALRARLPPSRQPERRKAETLGCSRGLFPGPSRCVVTGPVAVGRYSARDLWAVPGPGPGATQTTWCERRSRRCPLQAGQGDSDGPPCCRRHLSAAAAWQCGRRDAAVAATVSPGSAPPILRRGRTTHAGNDVCVGTVTVKTMDYSPSHWQLNSE